MELAKDRLCGIPLIRVVGDVDHLTGPAFLGTVEEALEPQAAHVLLDLESCPYLDSGGMSVLLAVLRKVKSRLGWLGVIAPSRDVHRLLEIVGLTVDPHFRVFPDLTRAEEQLQAEVPAG